MRTAAKVDLHCHTHVSDNSLTVQEVIRAAKAAGISHLAVTDHDTTLGIAEAVSLGTEYGITIIPGIEISAYDFQRKRKAHLLGYYITPEHPSLAALCGPVAGQRHLNAMRMVEIIREAGYNITWDEVRQYAQGGSAVFKQHIMHALMDHGYCTEILGPLHKKLFSRGEAGSEPGLAYIPMQYVDAKAAIRAIREAGGVPVLAHPGQLGNFDAVPEWVNEGLEGIEALHLSHSAADEATARTYAAEYDLVITGGSDFHGMYGSSAASFGNIDAGIASVAALEERRALLVAAAKL